VKALTEESANLQQTSAAPDGIDLIKAEITDYNDVKILDGYIWSSNEFFIEVRLPNESGVIQKLPLDSKVKVLVKSPFTSEICYFVTVAGVTDHTARMKIRHKILPDNKREYYRAATNITAALEYQLIGDEKRRLPHPIRITVKNISCGGMMFVASQDLGEGEAYQTTLKLQQEPLTIKFKVLRKTVANEQVYFFGAFFMENTPHKQDIICAYVNKMQMEELMKIDKL